MHQTMEGQTATGEMTTARGTTTATRTGTHHPRTTSRNREATGQMTTGRMATEVTIVVPHRSMAIMTYRTKWDRAAITGEKTTAISLSMDKMTGAISRETTRSVWMRSLDSKMNLTVTHGYEEGRGE